MKPSVARCAAAFRAWRRGSGELLPYVRSTNFASLARYRGDLPVAADSPVADVPDSAADELLLLDLPAATCLRTGLHLAAQRGLWPVLTFAHWFHPRGIVGDLAAADLLLRRQPPASATAGWCLLLDYDRYTDSPLPADRFNNQYELVEDDLPTADELHHLGLRGAALFSAVPPKDDLRRYAAYLEAANLTVRWLS